MSAVATHARTVLAPRKQGRSRLGRLLLPAAVLWFFALAFGLDLLPRIAPGAPSPPTGLTRDALLVLSLLPLGIWFLSAIVGPRGRFRRLFERESPRVVVDDATITLKLPKGRDRILVYNAIGALRARSPLRGGFLLTDPKGGKLARIPASLVMAVDQVTGRPTSLATAVVQHRPDRYVALRGPFEGLPTRFRLRGPDEPPTDWVAIARAGRRIVMAVSLTAVFAVAVLVGMAIGRFQLA